jgi:hypothetical protein
VEWWYRRHSERPYSDPVYTEEKCEVAAKPFSHRESLKDFFNNSLSPRVPISSGHHVSNFPDRIVRAIVFA